MNEEFIPITLNPNFEGKTLEEMSFKEGQILHLTIMTEKEK